MPYEGRGLASERLGVAVDISSIVDLDRGPLCSIGSYEAGILIAACTRG